MRILLLLLLAVAVVGVAAQVGGENAKSALEAYLRCEDLDCAEALKALVRHRAAVVPPLIAVVENGAPPELLAGLPGDASTVARVRAIGALGALEDWRALDPLIRAAAAPNPLVRSAAAEALPRVDGRRALAALVSLLADPDELVREKSAAALGELDLAEAVPALQSAAAAEQKPHVRRTMEAAVRSIERRR